MMRRALPRLALLPLLALSLLCAQEKIFIPMDLQQSDHLKAYGIAYWALTKGAEVDWLLNYRGGSFLISGREAFTVECRVRNVSFVRLGAVEAASVYAEV